MARITLAEETRFVGEQLTLLRFWCDDEKTIWLEERYAEGRRDGILREWTPGGRLRAGHPRFRLGERDVDRASYLRACARDAALPAWTRDDDRPTRALPPEYVSSREARLGA